MLNVFKDIFALRLILSYLISFLITVYLIPIMCQLSCKLNCYDLPDEKLKKHKVPISFFGGVAVYLGFIAALALTFPFNNDFFLYLISATLLLFVGLIDDLIAISPAQKFAGQAIASLGFIKAGFFLKEVAFFNPLNLLLSLFWFLTVINAFNLVDVMDGLSSTLAMGSATGFLIFTIIGGNYAASVLLVCLLGALSGFFLYNKPPAKIYLGDSGSLFVGGLLASIPFFINWSQYDSFGFLIPIALLGLPLLELGLLILIRSFKGIPFYLGSPDHFSIYLQNKKWTKKSILLLVSFINLIICILSLLFFYLKISLLMYLFSGCLLLALWLSLLFF